MQYYANGTTPAVDKTIFLWNIHLEWNLNCAEYSLNIKMITTYDVGNSEPGLRQAQKCGRVIQFRVLRQAQRCGRVMQFRAWLETCTKMWQGYAIQSLAWDRHKDVAGLYNSEAGLREAQRCGGLHVSQLTRSQFPLDLHVLVNLSVVKYMLHPQNTVVSRVRQWVAM